MKITVCVKRVADLDTVEVHPLTGRVDASRLLYVMNPADASALEVALRAGGDVSAVAVGDEAAEEVLREALAAGAETVMRLWGTGWTDTRPLWTARMIAAALQRDELPDVIFCGNKTVDRGSGQVPALLAELLGWPVVTDITAVELREGEAVVQRRLARGAREKVTVQLPAVLGLEPDLARLREGSLPRLMAAQRAEIPVVIAAELGVEIEDDPFTRSVAAPRPRPKAIFTPDSEQSAEERIGQILAAGVTRESGRIVQGEPEEMAEVIVGFLRERGFLDE